MRTNKRILSVLLVLSMCLAVLAGCGAKETASAPQNLTYDKTTGSFQFDALKGAQTYIVGVSRIINDTTGKALAGINQSSLITLSDGSTAYLWSEQTGSVSGLADNDNDGIVKGTVVYREYSSSATTVGAVIRDLSTLPVGHYVLQAIAASTDALPNPEPALYEFTITGSLAAPAGFTAQINAESHMEITAGSNYYHSCMTVTGLPEKMVFEIFDGSELVETIETADFSYTNSVNGPNKGFTYNNETVTGTVVLDPAKTYTVTITAVGDGGEIKDASATAYMGTSTPAVELQTKYDQAGSGTAGDYSISVSLGLDASGSRIYELTANVNNVAILRESGTYTALLEQTDEEGNTVTVEAEPEEVDGKLVYPEGTVLSFTTAQSDADSPVLDGVVLTAAQAVSEGWGQTSTTYYLAGSAAVNGMSFEFTQGSGSSSMGGPPPA